MYIRERYLVYLFHKYLLMAYSLPGTLLGIGDKHTRSLLCGIDVLVGR